MNSSSKKILIVEDDQRIASQLIEKIEQLKIAKKVDWKTSISSALNTLQKKPIDVLVLDLNLPDGNGVQILKWIRTQELKTQVFVFSINTTLKTFCLKNGATAFFDKSNDLDLLLEELSEPVSV